MEESLADAAKRLLGRLDARVARESAGALSPDRIIAGAVSECAQMPTAPKTAGESISCKIALGAPCGVQIRSRSGETGTCPRSPSTGDGIGYGGPRSLPSPHCAQARRIAVNDNGRAHAVTLEGEL